MAKPWWWWRTALSAVAMLLVAGCGPVTVGTGTRQAAASGSIGASGASGTLGSSGATGATGSTGTTGTVSRICHPDQLSLSMPFGKPSSEWFLSGPPGGQRIVFSLHLVNTGSSTCALGEPTVSLVGSSVQPHVSAVSTAFASALPTKTNVTVQPGGYAQVLLATPFPSACPRPSIPAVSIQVLLPGWTIPIISTLPPPDPNAGYRGFLVCTGSLSISWPIPSSDTNPFGLLEPSGTSGSGVSGASSTTSTTLTGASTATTP